MSEYNTGTVNVTNGDATVEGVGTAFLSNVAAGDIFTKLDSGVIYYVGSVTDDTHLELTGNYAGATESGINYTISTSFTSPDDIPYPEPGDTQPATIAGAAIAKIQALFTGILSGTKAFTNPAAVRTQLVARALHKTDTRPAAADMNAGDLWADTDYATGLCAVYCIIDPTNAALDTLDYFIKTDTGGRLNLENSIATTIDCSAGGTITLSALQNAYGHYNLTGSPSADFNLVVDNRARRFTVNNATGKVATVKTSGGSGITVPNGIVQELRGDGTNVVVTDFNPEKTARYVAVTSNTSALDVNKWTQIARVTISSQYDSADRTIHLLSSSGASTDIDSITANIRVKQQAAFGNDPQLSIEVFHATGILNPEHIAAVIIQNTPTTIVDFYVFNARTYSTINIYDYAKSGSAIVQWLTSQAFIASISADAVGDWAGSEWLTLTPGNGWTGNFYYRKSADGIVYYMGSLSAGTKTDGTTVVTFPVGYRASATQYHHAIISANVTGGVGGRLVVPGAGTLLIYNMEGAPSTFNFYGSFPAEN